MSRNNPGDKNWTLIEGWISISLNTVLFGLKLWVGLITGSVALTADAYHTLQQALASRTGEAVPDSREVAT